MAQRTPRSTTPSTPVASPRRPAGQPKRKPQLTADETRRVKAALPRLEELLRQPAFEQAPQVALRVVAANVGVSESVLRQCLFLPEGELNVQNVLEAIADQVRSHGVTLDEHTKRLDRHGKDIAGLKPALTAVHGKADALAKRLADIERIIGHESFVKALQAGSVGGRRSFMQALRDRHVTDEHIRQTLTILDDGNELDMTDEVLFGEVFETLRSMRSDLTTVTQRVDRHDEILGAEGEHFVALRQRVNTVENGGSYPGWAWPVAIIVGVAAWWLWLTHDFDTLTKVGNVDVTLHSAASWWWVAVIVGVAASLAVLGLIGLFVGGGSHTESRFNTAFRERYNAARRVRSTQSSDSNLVPPVPVAPAPVQDGDTVQYAPVGNR